MQIDLSRDIPKTPTTDSERTLDPAVTCENARAAFARVGIQVEMEFWNHDDVMWTARATTDSPCNDFNTHALMDGKGRTRSQCEASCWMELADRFTQYFTRHPRTSYADHVFDGYNLRTGQTVPVFLGEGITSFGNATGNTYEECILHGLHEMIESAFPAGGVESSTGSGGSWPWRAHQVVDFANLFPDWPDWMKDSFVVIRVPTPVPEFYHFVAIRAPIDLNFEPEARFVLGQDGILGVQRYRHCEPEGRLKAGLSTYSGSCGGINPGKCIERAIGECFQRGPRESYRGRRKPVPDGIEVVDAADLP